MYLYSVLGSGKRFIYYVKYPWVWQEIYVLSKVSRDLARDLYIWYSFLGSGKRFIYMVKYSGIWQEIYILCKVSWDLARDLYIK